MREEYDNIVTCKEIYDNYVYFINFWQQFVCVLFTCITLHFAINTNYCIIYYVSYLI